MTPPQRVIQQAGFSLMEVMIALLVLAIALGALIEAGGNAARNASRMQERTIAHWVAENVAAELRLEAALAPTGKREGKETQLGRTWRWRATLSSTPDPDLRRVDIEVAEASEADFKSVTTLAVFLGKP